MVQRAAIVLFVGGLLASAGGCGVIHALVYEPFGPNSLCDATHCDDGSCGSCAASVGPEEEAGCGAAVVRGRWCRVHRVFGCRVCADACESCGEPCGEVYDCRRPGPLTWLFGLLRCATFCGSGCGPRYWGDWYGDPPDCCDPCDNYGNFTGGSGGGCSNCGGAPQYAAAGARAATCSSCGQPIARATAKSAKVAATAYSRSRAPRIISQTDRAVNPAEDDDTPHLARPRRAVPQ
jgi:hypothetical protein